MKHLCGENPLFEIIEGDLLEDVVTVGENFDDLLIGEEHPSRTESDTYYMDADHVLRTHMTAHMSRLIRKNKLNYLTIGDCIAKTKSIEHIPTCFIR